MTTRHLTLLGSVGLIALALAAACSDTTAGQRGSDNPGGAAGESNADGGSKSSGGMGGDGSGGGNTTGGAESGGSNGNGGSSGGSDGTGGASGGSDGTGGASGGTGGGDNTGGSGGGSNGRPPFTGAFDCSAATGTIPALKLTPFASGLTEPVFMAPFPGVPGRFLIVEQGGLIKLFKDGSVASTPFLDLKSKTQHAPGGDERGVLSIAFHPNYAENGLFYVYHTASSSLMTGVSVGDSVIAEYKVNSQTADVADVASMRIVLTVPQPYANNKGVTIAFGGDGMLYVGLGDGGGPGDPYGNGQSLTTLLGKVLRIDVDARSSTNGQYGIPEGNLIEENPNALPEIWDLGLRNPYRWSFDGCTGDLFIADSGNSQQEEVNFEAAHTGHKNYGWKTMEGTLCYAPSSGCNVNGLTQPVTTYATATGAAVVGGYVYRGSAIPALRGHYFYADYIQSKIRSFRWDGSQAQDVTDRTADLVVGQYPSALAQDLAGEIYVINLGGTISRIDKE